MAIKALGTVMHTLRRSLLRLDVATLTDGELLERFVKRRDEAAFETLVHRHGPMVLGACRRLLQNESDAEDAFQATFLVLVRKADSVRPRGMVGNWLYGVAHTTARKARAMRTKRFARERQAAVQSILDDSATIWEDIEGLLDQELKGLPERYRAAIILSDLEGKSLKEAAQTLGCPPATIGTRLARARAMLARRLRRQGVALSAGALAAALSQHAAAGAVPAGLTNSCVNAVGLTAGSAAATRIISAKVAVLTESTLKMMLLARLKILSLILAPMVIGWAGLACTPLLSPDQPPTASAPNERFIAEGIRSPERPPAASSAPLPDAEPNQLNRINDSSEAPNSTDLARTKKLPPGLANKSARHPGRVAWLKSHGS